MNFQGVKTGKTHFLRRRRLPLQRGILHSEFAKGVAPQSAAVAASAGTPRRVRIVAAVRQGVVDAEGKSEFDDLRLAQMLERRADVVIPALVDRLCPEARTVPESFNECRAAVRIAGIIQRIDPDENVTRPDSFRQSRRKGEKNQIPRGDIGNRNGTGMRVVVRYIQFVRSQSGGKRV